MTFYDEKPKHEKPKNDYEQLKERGGCLSVFLVVITLFSVLNLPLTLWTFGQIAELAELADSPFYIGPDPGLFTVVNMISLVVAIAQLFFIYSLWNWKEIGYRGMLGVYGINMVLALALGTPQGAVGAGIGMAVLYFLMRDKMHYLE